MDAALGEGGRKVNSICPRWTDRMRKLEVRDESDRKFGQAIGSCRPMPSDRQSI